MAPDTERSRSAVEGSSSDNKLDSQPSEEESILLDQVMKPMHEDSPLLSTSGSSSSDEGEELNGRRTPPCENDYDEFEESKGFWYMLLLTVCIGGLQFAWTVEFSNGTPYLLSLGISKSIMALVWIAGPLSGSLVQPYIGMLSDNCRSSWGKRRPFMIAGTIATVLSLAGLAWVKEMVGGFLGIFGVDGESHLMTNTIIVVAVAFVYILDFSINTVQAAIRAFILDCCPSHQQESANSMASRVVSMGNILGFMAGYVNLRKYFTFFGNTQFKVLCVLASFALTSTVILSGSSIKERDPRNEPPPNKSNSGLFSFFKQVFSSIRKLPPQTRKVCEIQFFCWIGFFPLLFYSSSYVGDIYVQSFLEENPNMTSEELDILYEKATRIGTFALLMYAIVSLATNLILPIFVAPTFDAVSSGMAMNPRKGYRTWISRALNSLVIPWLTLRRAWLISHIIFAFSMFATLIVKSVAGATTIIAIVGIPWALQLWAPWAIISSEVSKRDALRRLRQSSSTESDDVAQAGIILGIHNMSIAMPQVIATLGSSLAFRFFQKPRGMPGDHSFSMVLASGGIFTLVAAWLTSRIKDEVAVSPEAGLEEGEGGEVGGIDYGRLSTEDIQRERRRSSTVREGRPLIRNSSFGGGVGNVG